MAGIIGVAKENCLKDLFYGTDYQSHLETEYGGLAIFTGKDILKSTKYIGKSQLKSAFEYIAEKEDNLIGHYGIGAISEKGQRQPVRLKGKNHFALVVDAYIANAETLIKNLQREGVSFNPRGNIISNAEIVGNLINKKEDIVDGIENVFSEIVGDCSLLLLNKDGIYAARDKYGLRPLVLSKCINSDGFAVATESCSFPNIGFEIERDLKPGEILFFDDSKYRTERIVKGSKLKIDTFLWPYFGNPGSSYEGINVEDVRLKIGAALARQDNIKVDIVASVPDSGTFHAIGYANESGIPFMMPLIKYGAAWGRSYMPPIQSRRDEVAHYKLIPVPRLIKDKELIIVDDSIRRGTQLRNLLEKKVWPYKPKAVHVRIASPLQFFPCIRGEGNPHTLATRKAIAELEGKDLKDISEYMDESSIKHAEMIEQMRKNISATTLKFISLDDMTKAISLPMESLCLHCWTGEDYHSKNER